MKRDRLIELLYGHVKDRREELDAMNRRRMKHEDYLANSGRHDELDKLETAIEIAIKKARETQ